MFNTNNTRVKGTSAKMTVGARGILFAESKSTDRLIGRVLAGILNPIFYWNITETHND